MRAIGFKRLTPAEVELLLSFDSYHELVLPEYIPNGLNSIRTLAYKGIVVHSTPYKLTNKGIILYNYLTTEEGINEYKKYIETKPVGKSNSRHS